MRHPLDFLLTTDPLQRLRLAQAGLAMVMVAVGVLGMHYFVWAGVAAAVPVTAWTVISLGGMVTFFVLIRSGWSRRLSDPSMTVPQMVYALACGAVAYAVLGPARGAVFPILMVVLMFGMFVASPRQMAAVSLYAVVLFGATILALAVLRPEQYPPRVEAGHFLMIATMVPVAALLAGRVAQMRRRLRARRDELARALERIRDLATRDELTGLINRRHMLELIEQERQRCVRSGQTFCLARLDIDRFKLVNERHGYAVGDQVLRSLGQEAARQVRSADLVARWGGEEFMLMLPDTRAALARGGIERLIQRLAALRLLHGDDAVAVTLTGGLAEHLAGETTELMLERVSAALVEAKSEGSNRVKVV
jgi:diguanylate cyclase